MKITRKQRQAIKAWLEWRAPGKPGTCVRLTEAQLDTVSLVLLKLLEGEEEE